jgi:hypothetical protein
VLSCRQIEYLRLESPLWLCINYRLFSNDKPVRQQTSAFAAATCESSICLENDPAMETAALFSELRLLIPNLRNCAPANPQLLHLSAADVSHLGGDHWENLQDALGLKTVFGWDERGGILSASSSKADFQLVFEFLERLHLAEEGVPPQESCSGQLETRLKRTVLIWYAYSWGSICSSADVYIQPASPTCCFRSQSVLIYADPYASRRRPEPVSTDLGSTHTYLIIHMLENVDSPTMRSTTPTQMSWR